MTLSGTLDLMQPNLGKIKECDFAKLKFIVLVRVLYFIWMNLENFEEIMKYDGKF